MPWMTVDYTALERHRFQATHELIKIKTALWALYSAFIHECRSPSQEQGSEHLWRAGPARRHKLGNVAVSYGRVGDGLLLRVEGGEVYRKG